MLYTHLLSLRCNIKMVRSFGGKSRHCAALKHENVPHNDHAEVPFTLNATGVLL